MIGKDKNKMVSNDSRRDFHFAGAGSNLPPTIIKAASIEEAEKIWREKNDIGSGGTGSYEN